tara:strand:+ start:785 stop:1150 length:366 start_codon:yes stop_codon:yes gene_type:complete
MKDFRFVCFEITFNNKSLEDKDLTINLSENQTLRAKQLIQNTKENEERIENSIRTYSENWTYERIGKVEITTLTLGISELLMELSPKKVIISEWVKITDMHSSSKGAKFVNGILDRISNEI